MLALPVMANVAAGYPQGVQLTVSIRGGVMDDDRVISVYGNHLTVTDHGRYAQVGSWNRTALTSLSGWQTASWV